MKKLIAYFIRYPIWTNVLMFSLLSFGVISFFSMKFSAFPETEPSLLFVRVPFIGASPEEVEEGVIIKIEEALEGLEGIERITSEARENIGTVNVEILDGADINTVLADVKNAVDRISSFPVGIEKPVISAQPRISQAVQVVVFGETDLYNLKYISESIRDELLASDEISQVTVVGVPSLEISIEVAEADLRRYELTFDEIAAKVRSANVNISGGKFDTNDEEILIRAYGRDYYANELRDLVVRGSEAGTVLYLKDVAEIEERWQDVPDKSYYNDKPAVILDVDKTLEESVLDVVAKTQEIVDAFNAQHTQVRAVLIDDQSQGIGQRLNLLITNGLIGTMLVVITIGFFMNIRLSFWVSIGIPISFAGMFLVALLSGLTINVISTFGMVIVIGILVDDAIVVGENIFAHYERGKPPLQAAIDGTIEMLAPVFTSVTTTIIAFTPFFFIEGFLGKFIWQMALVVIASLFFSLVEAFFILPAHLAHSKGLHPHAQDPRIRRKIEAAIQFLTQKLYAPTLRAAMRHKWITVVTPI
ncbi:efflux RND transporter permease subunit, partial [candidate division KSB1 bacterium]|nr:efflux RND transporter permease subunit [candidate division KSB1 bacterium]